MPIAIALALGLYAVTIWRRPYWGVYIILALLPSYQIRFTFATIPTTFLEWLILLLAAVVFIKFLQKSEVRNRAALILKQNPLFFVFSGLFLFAGVISVWVSPETARALGLFKAYIFEGLLFLFLSLLLLDSKEKIFGAIKSLGVLILCLSLFGLFQFLTLYRLPPSWWGPGVEPRRVVSLFTYPNAVSLLITPILGLFTALLLFKDKVSNLISTTFVVWVNALGIILLILTFSRGAWIGYAVGIFLLLLFTQYKKAMLGLFLLLLTLILIIPTTRNRLLPVFEGRDPASFERVKLYKGTWEIIKERPLTGAGLYGFRDAYITVRQSETDEILNYPHNFFLNFWVETGLLGVLSVTVLLLYTFWQAVKLYKKNEATRPLILAACAALVVLFVHGQVDAPFFKNDLAVLFWFLTGTIPLVKLSR